MEPGVCPATGMTVSSASPTATVSPSITRRDTGTPVADWIASASGSPAMEEAPVTETTSARARWWSQC